MEHQSNGTLRATPPDALWIDRPDAMVVPAGAAGVGLDTEFMRRNTYYPKLALIQAATAGTRWLLDPLAYAAGSDLQRLVHGRICVMHSASEDLEALLPLLGEQPLQLFDTQIAAALCGLGAGISYQKLVASLLGIAIAKDETCSDWLQRPLSSSQLHYAEQDVHHLAALHLQLDERLHELGRAQWHREDCARLVQRARRHRLLGDPQPQRAFRAAADWPRPVQARLRRVLNWREVTARKLDKPRPWLVDDAHALALAQEPPRTAAELFERVRGQRALRSQQRAELFDVLHATTTPEELATLAPIPAAPHGNAKRAVDAMRQAVRVRAEQLGLPPGLLCPRRLIEEFAVTRTWPEELAGWRAGVLRDDLTARLGG